MKAEAAQALERLRALLSPGVLREEVVLGFERAREAFRPGVLQPRSPEEMLAEVVRFVGHVNRSRYARASAEEWPRWLAERDAHDLLDEHYGSVLAGKRALWRLAERSGMRAVLNVVSGRVQEDRLRAYLRMRVQPVLDDLHPETRYRVAEAYLAAFRDYPGLTLEHPALLMERWPLVLDQHARLVLGWT